MPSSIATVIVGPDEPLVWSISETVHAHCGETFYTAETIDGNIAITARSLDALDKFASSLHVEIAKYQAKESAHASQDL